MPRPITPLLTVDVVLFDARGRVLLIKRGHPPFKGGYALPGGFVDVGETVEAAARRELLEETGIVAGQLTLLGVYSKPERDPRGHTVSVVFRGRVRSTVATAGDDAAAVEWVAGWRKAKLAFDHAVILADAAKAARRRTRSA
jgi:8-oxo-dGTP diphosphatase